MLVARNYQPSNLVRLLPAPVRTSVRSEEMFGHLEPRGRDSWAGIPPKFMDAAEPRRNQVPGPGSSEVNELLYLFGCQVEWQLRADPSAAWEVISAARSLHPDTRAHARSLLECSQQMEPQLERQPPKDTSASEEGRSSSTTEASMRAPNGVDIIESCMGCKARRDGFFCCL